MNSLTVLGSGAWGTALSMIVAQNLQSITLWGRDTISMKIMHKVRCNYRYLQNITFPDNLKVSANLSDTINQDLCFLIAVPSHAFRTTLESLKKEIIRIGYSPKNSTIIWGTKGFDPHTGDLLENVLLDVFGEISRQGVISGPSFALETVSSSPTALILASKDQSVAKSLSQWFRTDTISVDYTEDTVGVQLGGAIKNVMALATGIIDGLGYGANPKAALITRGFNELTKLGIVLGGQIETFMGLTGIGDLMLTCTNYQSRNRRFGLGIGMGKSPYQMRQEIRQEIEGINTTRELYILSKRLKIDMPITHKVYKILYENLNPDVAVKELLKPHPTEDLCLT